MMPVIKGWISVKGIFTSFKLTNTLNQDIEIIYANYSKKTTEGEAYVLFRKKIKLYEVFASHCGCYGLEGQWFPEETCLFELEMKLVNPNYHPHFKEDLKEVVQLLRPTPIERKENRIYLINSG